MALHLVLAHFAECFHTGLFGVSINFWLQSCERGDGLAGDGFRPRLVVRFASLSLLLVHCCWNGVEPWVPFKRHDAYVVL